ncbi:hypothetical protein BUE80_DR003932 [Diplocarpon rosae]|nr:hypothetical protein BUE80_DR003932 [Diplocarpon rosae]
MARPLLMASEESLVAMPNKSFFDDSFFPDYNFPFVTTAMTSNATPELVAPVSATAVSPATVDSPDDYLTAVATHENTNSDAQQVHSGEMFRLDQGDVNMGLLQGSFQSGVKRPHQAQEHQSPTLNFDHNSQTNALLGNPAHSYAVEFEGLTGGPGITNGFQEAQEHRPDYATQIDVSMADPALLNATLATQGFGGPSDDGPNFTEEEMAERTTQVLETLQSLTVPNQSSSSIHQGHCADDWYNQVSQLGSGIPPPLMFPSDMQVGGYDSLGYGQQVMQDGDQKVQGFAKIEFPDGHFYLNSYQLKIGRDIVAQRIHKKQMAKAMSHHGGGHGQAKSMISDTAGFVRHFDDEDVIEDNMSRRKRRKERDTSRSAKRFKKSRSSESSSQYLSRRQSLAPPTDATHMYQSSFEQPAKVDVEKHRPSPHKLATVLIHPANKNDEAAWNGISRDHLLIAFNFDKNLWEAHVRGRNGCFLEEEYKGTGEVFPLPNGARLQIGAVLLLWRLPEHIPIGKTGAEEDAFSDEEMSPGNEQVTACVMNGKEMSLEFAHERRAGLGVSDDDSEGDSHEEAEPEPAREDEDLDNEASEMELGEEDDAEPGLQHQRLFSDASEDEDDKDQDEEKDQQELELELEDDSEGEEEIEDIKPPPKKAPALKKRGAGRPPKGEKSKRQLMEEKKAAAFANEKAVQQADKKTSKKEERELKSASKGVKDEPTSQAPPETTNKPAAEGEKRKVGRPRKHPKPENASEPREKRKYTKRKPKEPKDGDSKPEGATGENEPNDEGKEQKQGRAVRSPSPTFNEEDLTPEQLAKPSCNYVQLIYEALSESPYPKMSLPQIYRAIQRKHPYFVCRVTTVGWQSSVRHNLGQNEGFEKVERDGKGWKWGIKAGATFEKEKKKKSSPQPQYPQGMQPIYPGIAHGYYHPHPGMMMPPQGYQMSPQMPANYRPGQQPYMGLPPAHMNGYYQPGSQPLMNGQPHITIPAALAPPTSTAYSSPYGPKPATPNGPSAGEQSAPSPADKPTSPLAPQILDNSVKKVLGQMPDSAGHPEEKSIVEVLRNMLGKIGLQHPTYHPAQSNDQQSPQQPPTPQSHVQSQQHPSHTRTQASASSQSPANSTGPDRQNPTIVRPSFHTQSLSRPTGTRPLVSSMVRSNSNSSCAPLDHNTPGSPAAALPASDTSGVPLYKNAGSPAPPPPASVSNEASTPKSTGDMGQSKEPGPTEATGNAEESQDFKTSFMPRPLVETT